jgi:serine/threonine-protein phosphatase 4 regulatory subunit 4
MAAAIETALLAPLSPAEKPAGTATVEKLDGQGEAAHAFQDAAVTQEELDRLTVGGLGLGAAPLGAGFWPPTGRYGLPLPRPFTRCIVLHPVQVPDGISDADRAQRYLSSGEAVQQVAVIENLPGLLRAAGRGVFPAISRGLVEAARQLDGEGQLAAADSFATVARERLLGPAELADVVLPLVLAGVGDDGHPQAQASWLACLQELAAALDPATLHARVLPAVAARGGGAGRLLRERCLCCQLLGALALHVDEEDLKRSLLRLAAALCQDTEWQVRHAACQQLPALAAAAAAKLEEAALEGVLEELFGLLGDEEALVRAAAWRALAAALDLLPPRLRRARALPALLRQCREPEHHAEVHRAVTAGFGVLLTRMVADMEGEGEVNACLLYYRGQAWRHDHATRINCAAAFPAVLRAATPRRYGSHLHDTFARLAADGDPEVRLAAAEGLPEVAAALGPDRCCQYLRQPAAALLQDERREVQAALLARLPQLLHAFCPEPPAEEARHKAAAAFVEPLLRLEAASGHSWRLQLALLQAMACFPAFFAPEALHDRFLPLAWKHMAEGAAAVRGAAAAAAAAIWRALRKQHQRTGLYSRLVHDFGQVRAGATVLFPINLAG